MQCCPCLPPQDEAISISCSAATKRTEKDQSWQGQAAALSRLCHGCLIHAAAVILRPGRNRLSMATATRSEQTVVRV